MAADGWAVAESASQIHLVPVTRPLHGPGRGCLYCDLSRYTGDCRLSGHCPVVWLYTPRQDGKQRYDQRRRNMPPWQAGSGGRDSRSRQIKEDPCIITFYFYVLSLEYPQALCSSI